MLFLSEIEPPFVCCPAPNLVSRLFRFPDLQGNRGIFMCSYSSREMDIRFMGKKLPVHVGWEAGRALGPIWR
jgi:hypothetical protein